MNTSRPADRDYSSIDVDELHFDPLNPRIPRSVDPTDDQAVLEWMLEDAGLLELMGSIAVNGYFPAEPLLVTPRPDASGFLVLEGNRRLAAVLLLRDPTRAPKRRNAVAEMARQVADPASLASLPCAVFRQRSDVLDYLGYRHITGIKQWEPLAKARYLDELYREHLESAGDNVYRRIARIIGSRADYVSRLLGALRLYETMVDEAATAIEETLSDVSFSLLTLALNYASIVRFLGLPTLEQESFVGVNRSHLSELYTWLYVEQVESGRTQLGDSRNMRYLAAAVDHPEGLAALRRGEPAEEAARATVDATELFLRAVRAARDRLLSAQALLHRAEVSTLEEGALEEVEDLAGELAASVRRKVRRRGRADV
jgi:hypothetical protein